jgi:hypothetical protein
MLVVKLPSDLMNLSQAGIPSLGKGGTKGYRDALLDKTRGIADGLAPTNLAAKHGEADATNGKVRNDIRGCSEPKIPQFGLEGVRNRRWQTARLSHSSRW